jgi:hypothetical protein
MPGPVNEHEIFGHPVDPAYCDGRKDYLPAVRTPSGDGGAESDNLVCYWHF